MIDAPFNQVEPPTANEVNRLRIERFETVVQSMPALDSSRSRYPAIFLQSAEVAIGKRDSKSVGYENRTKSVESGGSETNGRRERISGLGRCVAVRRFAREGPCLLGISAGSEAGGECWSR